MTDSVAAQIPVTEHVGNGVTTSFAYTFTILDSADMVVEIDGVAQGSGFTVSGVGVLAGGAVLFTSAPASGVSVLLRRSTDLSRSTSYTYAGDLRETVVDEDFNRLWHAMQERAEVEARSMRAPVGETLDALPPASQRADTQLLFDNTGEPYCGAPVSGSAADVMLQYASTDAGKGAALVGVEGGGTVTDAIGAYVLNAASDGVTDARAAVVAADAAASSAGQSLIIPPGTYLISAAYTFAARIIMRPGARFKVTASGAYLKFSSGFDAGLFYCLDTDQPTEFFKTEAIYPQWFGATGLFADNATTAITRALLACRSNTTAGATPNGLPDAQHPCGTVRFVGAAVYRISGVPLYSGTTLEFVGEAGSLNGTAISQISNLVPAFYVCPVNVSITGTVINESVGQNFITGGKFYSEIPASASDGEPIFAFLSPAQAYSQLGLAGTPGAVGHIDTSFRRVWGLNCNTFAKCTEGALWVHFEDSCQFDVCRRICYHTGTSYGMVSSIGTKGYAITWGAFVWDSTDTTTGYRIDVMGGELKAGNTASTDANQRRAININSTAAPVAGTFAKIVGVNFLTTTISATRHGGPIFIKNGCESVYFDSVMYDADSTNDQKFMAIQDGVKHLTIRGRMVSKTLASYTNSTMIQFSQSPQVLTDIHVDLSLVNENAGTFATAISSNFVIENVDLDRLATVGNFTALTNANITGRGRPINTVSSSATIALPPNGDVFLISGTTNITNITATGWTGKRATLIFQGILTLTDGGNLKLAGNFVTTADDVLTITCDGTNWYETGRSVN